MTKSHLKSIVGLPDFADLALPENYASRALRVFQDNVTPDISVPVIRSQAEALVSKIPATSLADPKALKKLFKNADVSWLGAFSTSAQTGQAASNPAQFASAASSTLNASSDTEAAQALGIIDLGVAFWNDRFVEDTTSRFTDVGFLSLEEQDNIWLGAQGLATLLSMGDATSRDEAVRKTLAQDFPQSVYAAKENGLRVYSAAGFSHGTAMSDIAMPDNDKPVFALELPSNVLLDSAGDLLEAHLIPAIRVLYNRMIEDTRITKNTEIVILLAFGYPGGPQDGTRPIVQELQAELSALSQHANVKLIIPAGNHLQERCHASWQVPANGATDPLVWVFPVEDYSANHVSIHYDKDRPEIILSDPLRNSVTWRADAEGFVHLMGSDGAVLGLGIDQPTAGGGGKIDIVLSAVNGETVSSQAGRWSLRFAGGSTQVKAWITRDDLAVPGAVARPRKQSWFDDDSYQIYGDYGRRPQDDSANTPIKRAGTVSALATFPNGAAPVEVVGAGAQSFDGLVNATYSGLPATAAAPSLEVVHAEFGSPGTLALGNASVTQFRVSGSSVAASMRAKALLSP